jgi:hypothetical protein
VSNPNSRPSDAGNGRLRIAAKSGERQPTHSDHFCLRPSERGRAETGHCRRCGRFSAQAFQRRCIVQRHPSGAESIEIRQRGKTNLLREFGCGRFAVTTKASHPNKKLRVQTQTFSLICVAILLHRENCGTNTDRGGRRHCFAPQHRRIVPEVNDVCFIFSDRLVDRA